MMNRSVVNGVFDSFEDLVPVWKIQGLKYEGEGSVQTADSFHRGFQVKEAFFLDFRGKFCPEAVS